MLPDFDEFGNTPPGIHSSTIDEVVEKFGRPLYTVRKTRSESLREFYNLVSRFALGMYINGSYITQKAAPNDVDILVVLRDDFDGHGNFAVQMKKFFNSSKYHLEIHLCKAGVDEIKIRHYVDEIWNCDRDGHNKGLIYIPLGEHHD